MLHTNTVDVDVAAIPQDSSNDDAEDAEDALVTERLKELMAEEYRLPRFDNDPLDAAAQADLEKALAAIRRFFKDEDPEANPEALEYFKWKDLNKSRFFQEVLRLFPHHSAIVVEFLDIQPAQIKRLMAVFHDRYVLPFARLSTPKTDLDLPLGNFEGYYRILDSDMKDVSPHLRTYHARAAVRPPLVEEVEYRFMAADREKEIQAATIRGDSDFLAKSPDPLPPDLQLLFKTNENLPNPKALALHRASCLLWRMANGSENFDEEEIQLEEDRSPSPFATPDQRQELHNERQLSVQVVKMQISLRLPDEVLLLSDPAGGKQKASELAASIASFITSYTWLFNSHAYDYIRESFFDQHWPPEWRFLSQDGTSYEDLISISRGTIKDEWPESLKDYIRGCLKHSLSRDLEEDLDEVMQGVTSTITSEPEDGYDKGRDEQKETGYLSHRLAQEYPVVALDFNEIQTDGSKYRGEMLQKRAKAKGSEEPTTVDQNIIHITETLDRSRLTALLRDPPPEVSAKLNGDYPSYLLVGLHACGDLSSATMIQSFFDVDSVRGLVVSYQAPTVAMKAMDLLRSSVQGHYRRSLLDSILSDLGARPQNLSKGNRDHPNRQKDADEDGDDTRFRIGKLPKEAYTGDDLTYAMHALRKLGFEGLITEDKMKELLESPRYANAEKEVSAVFFVRSLLARVIESFLLLDRYIFILEQREKLQQMGQDVSVQMLNLFDFKESPRNFVIVAEKRYIK
ncbi:hypothetical protein HDU96_010522 [Phlyctochytrium bullatum]|nr:hypothetical protein HDU96_010522 [Phlyctochytrium bullatum]